MMASLLGKGENKEISHQLEVSSWVDHLSFQNIHPKP
jgi:hypothetical protein